MCTNVFHLVADSVNEWVRTQREAGKSPEQIESELAEFDVWDRYDHDSDGEFNEPDGYLDHFQVVFAGMSQADGNPIQGEDAIWSHRSYAFYNTSDGPQNNPMGGVRIDGTEFWVGDDTMQPENGGRGVFAHEYAHDLGLPDLYDWSGYGNNNIEWWSLMAQHRVSGPGETMAVRAAEMSAWDKLQLGWLDYEVVQAGEERNVALAPLAEAEERTQAALVVLPDKEKHIALGQPFEGERMWWSGKGNSLDNTLTRTVDLTDRSTADMTMRARFDIEDCDCDYLYVEASTDNGASWQALDGTIDGQPFPRDFMDRPMIAGTTDGTWSDVTVPLDDVAGSLVQFRLRYQTDSSVDYNGFQADKIRIHADGSEIFADDAEAGDNGWQSDGFSRVGATVTLRYPHYYIASYRAYAGHDQYLRTGPYTFGRPALPNWATRFPYQDGLLVSYWDTSHRENNTSEHPGEGMVLVVDANPDPIVIDGEDMWHPGIATYDAPFSLERSDSFSLPFRGEEYNIRGKEAQPLFDDRRSYWSPLQPDAGVRVPKVGVGIEVLEQVESGMEIKVFSTV